MLQDISNTSGRKLTKQPSVMKERLAVVKANLKDLQEKVKLRSTKPAARKTVNTGAPKASLKS